MTQYSRTPRTTRAKYSSEEGQTSETWCSFLPTTSGFIPAGKGVMGKTFRSRVNKNISITSSAAKIYSSILCYKPLGAPPPAAAPASYINPVCLSAVAVWQMDELSVRCIFFNWKRCTAEFSHNCLGRKKKKWEVSSHAVFYYLQYIIYITDDREPARMPAVRTRGVQPGTCNEIRALSAGGDGFYPYVSSLLCFLV